MRISVVIPAYNAEPFMRRCLQSVFAQTLKPHEIIVMDDGSTDKTAALAAELGARVLSGPNRGPSFARNEAMRAASGEWIALLDADDLWGPQQVGMSDGHNPPGDFTRLHRGPNIRRRGPSRYGICN